MRQSVIQACWSGEINEVLMGWACSLVGRQETHNLGREIFWKAATWKMKKEMEG
jgi:hypothetical protein